MTVFLICLAIAFEAARHHAWFIVLASVIAAIWSLLFVRIR
jgi:hypothetical protein